MNWSFQQKAIAVGILFGLNLLWFFLFLVGGLFVKAIMLMVMVVSLPAAFYVLTL
jgi:hypothetical protein